MAWIIFEPLISVRPFHTPVITHVNVVNDNTPVLSGMTVLSSLHLTRSYRSHHPARVVERHPPVEMVTVLLKIPSIPGIGPR
jgi:hypothetical protein